MFHIVNLLLFSSIMFAAVYQFLVQEKWYDEFRLCALAVHLKRQLNF